MGTDDLFKKDAMPGKKESMNLKHLKQIRI